MGRLNVKVYVFFVDDTFYPGVKVDDFSFAIMTETGLEIVSADLVSPVTSLVLSPDTDAFYDERFRKLTLDLVSRVVVIPESWGPTKIKKLMEFIEKVK